MKKLVPLFIVLVAVSLWLAYLVSREMTAPPPDLGPFAKGQMAAFEAFPRPLDLPQTPFEDRDGDPVSFDDLSGKVLLINFWATWCDPCIEEMPTLVNLQERLGGRDFEVVTVSVDWQGYEVIDAFFAEHGIRDLTAFWDRSGMLPNQLEVIGLPLTILVGRDGEWLGRLDGPAEWNSADAIALINAAKEKQD